MSILSISTRSPLALIPALLAAVTVGACTIQQAAPAGSETDAGATGSSSSGGPAADEPPPPGITCMQVLQCIVDCPDTDAACPDACNAKGTTEAQSNVIAFATCIETEQCVDAECVQAKCAESLDACVASSKPKSNGASLQGDAPPGDVPADLVGSWAGASSGATERLIFNADGSGSWQSAYTSSSTGCFSFTSTTRSGNIVITDNKITVYATKVETEVQECKPPVEKTDEAPVTEEITFGRVDAETIKIVDSACAAKYAGYEYSIGQYCTSRLKRE